MNLNTLIEEIENILGETPEGVPILQVRRHEPAGDALWFEKITRFAGAIERLAPKNSVYRRMSDEVLSLHDPPKNSAQTAERLKAVLLALKEDLTEQTLRSTEEMIHTDMLADFLEMAERLVGDGFKNPSAVLAGSVLAEHMRRLCTKHNIVIHQMHNGMHIPKNVATMNADLALAGVYPEHEKHNVESWNELRLKALHGHYGEFTREEVRFTVSGIRDFMIRHPA